METKRAICPICGSACGLIVKVDGGEIVEIRGDSEDPNSRGYVCPKGVSLKHQHKDPDRLLVPMKRQGDSWTDVSWEDAMDDISTRLADIIAEHGKDAVAVFAGDGTTHSYETLFSIAALVTALGVRNLYTPGSMDSLPRVFASYLLYGNPGAIPVPDVNRAQYLLIIGGNPVVTNGSVMTAPGFARRMRDIQVRGGKVVTIDPRRSETAEKSDEHFFIYPETDGLFLLSLLHVVFETGKDRTGEYGKLINGWDKLKRLVSGFSPERTEKATGVAAADTRRIAREFVSSPSAVCYGRMGTCAQSFGAAASMLIDVLNIATGNFDRPGGAMFPSPAIELSAVMKALGLDGKFGETRTKANGLPGFNGELPCAALADEIEHSDGIKALIVIGGNPAVSIPNSHKFKRALAGLKLMVSLDPHINATSSCAHYVLPPAVGLEHEVYPLFSYSTAVHNVAKWAKPALEAPSTVRHDSEIIMGILSRTLASGSPALKYLPAIMSGLGKRFKSRRILRLLINVGPHGKLANKGRGGLVFKDLKDNPQGVDLGPMVPRAQKLLAKRGINIMPAELESEIERFDAFIEKITAIKTAAETDGTLALTSRRQLRFFNTSLHNIDSLVNGPDQCVLQISAFDGERLSINTGDRAIVETDIGSIEVGVEVTDAIAPGVASMPFGWNGPQPAARQKVLNANPGENVNKTVPESRIDELSAMSAFNGTRIRVIAKQVEKQLGE